MHHYDTACAHLSSHSVLLVQERKARKQHNKEKERTKKAAAQSAAQQAAAAAAGGAAEAAAAEGDEAPSGAERMLETNGDFERLLAAMKSEMESA